MNQGILIFSCLLLVGLVFGAPAGDEKVVLSTTKLFTAEDCGKALEDDFESECRALIPRYRWSVEKEDCVKDFYSGCDATANNFRNKDDCLKVAKPICQSAKN